MAYKMTEEDWKKVEEDMKGKKIDPATGRVRRMRPRPTAPKRPKYSTPPKPKKKNYNGN